MFIVVQDTVRDCIVYCSKTQGATMSSPFFVDQKLIHVSVGSAYIKYCTQKDNVKYMVYVQHNTKT